MTNTRVKFIVSEDIDVQRIGEAVQSNFIINPVFVMRSRFIPTSLSFGLTVLVSGIDFSQQHTFEIKIYNETNTELIYSTGLNQMPANPMATLDNFTFNLRLNNIPFEHEGAYRVELALDDDIFDDYFEVRKDGQ